MSAIAHLAGVILEVGAQRPTIGELSAAVGVSPLGVVNYLTGAHADVRFTGLEGFIELGPDALGCLAALASIDDVDVLRFPVGDRLVRVPVSEVVAIHVYHEKVVGPDGVVLADDVVLVADHESGEFLEVRDSMPAHRLLLSVLRVQLGTAFDLHALQHLEPGGTVDLWRR